MPLREPLITGRMLSRCQVLEPLELNPRSEVARKKPLAFLGQRRFKNFPSILECGVSIN